MTSNSGCTVSLRQPRRSSAFGPLVSTPQVDLAIRADDVDVQPTMRIDQFDFRHLTLQDYRLVSVVMRREGMMRPDRASQDEKCDRRDGDESCASHDWCCSGCEDVVDYKELAP